MQAAPTNYLPILILIPLVIWRMYGRIRRQIGRQPLSNGRPWITVTVFPILILLLSSSALAHPDVLAWMLAGLAGGVLLGIVGLGKTQFENTPQGLFYTPHAHIGIAVSLLFVGRVIYRFIQIYSAGPGMQSDPYAYTRSPMTLAIFGILAGYYVSYAIGLIRFRARASRESPTDGTST